MSSLHTQGAVEPVSCVLCGNDSDFAPIRSARVDHYMEALGTGRTRSSWAVCKRCSLVMQNPRPSAAALDGLYAGGNYHAITPAEVDERIEFMHHWFGKKVDFLTEIAPKVEGGARVLDIGCGIGEVIGMLRDRGLRTRGIQPDPMMARVGRERFGVDIADGYFGEGSFPDESFELVFSNHVFEHMTDPVGAARSVARVLAPGGLAVTYVPTYYKNRSWLARQGMNAAHNWYFTHWTLTRLFEMAGLEYVSHGYTNEAEVRVVMRKPVAGVEPTSRLGPGPSWEKVKQYNDYVLDARAVAYTPWRLAKTVSTFREVTGGRPRDVVAWFRRSGRARAEMLRLLVRNLTSPT